MNLSIVIPAYNEASRIENTLRTYHSFFAAQSHIRFELLVVPNGCTDTTIEIVERLQQELGQAILIHKTQNAGKGLAIKAGFLDALTRDNHIIGFVDADMATRPFYFLDLIRQLDGCDGVIASRYMPGAQVYPPRPAIKRWGSRLIYESLVRSLFKLNYYDLQCGAKVFTRPVIEKIAPLLTVKQWAFDVELLFLCAKYGFTIKEHPTIWYDQTDSKLTMKAGMRMLGSLIKLWYQHRAEK